jgi:hypothetical protein
VAPVVVVAAVLRVGVKPVGRDVAALKVRQVNVGLVHVGVCRHVRRTRSTVANLAAALERASADRRLLVVRVVVLGHAENQAHVRVLLVVGQRRDHALVVVGHFYNSMIVQKGVVRRELVALVLVDDVVQSLKIKDV